MNDFKSDIPEEFRKLDELERKIAQIPAYVPEYDKALYPRRVSVQIESVYTTENWGWQVTPTTMGDVPLAEFVAEARNTVRPLLDKLSESITRQETASKNAEFYANETVKLEAQIAEYKLEVDRLNTVLSIANRERREFKALIDTLDERIAEERATILTTIQQYQVREAVLVDALVDMVSLFALPPFCLAVLGKAAFDDAMKSIAKARKALSSLPQAEIPISDQDPEKLRAEGAEAERERIYKLLEAASFVTVDHTGNDAVVAPYREALSISGEGG